MRAQPGPPPRPPRLSVLCITRDPGRRVACVLGLLRDVADEVVVAADATVAPGDLAWYASVADAVHCFEHRGGEEHLAWAHALCAGEWILRVDGDEVPSQELRRELAGALADRSVEELRLPRRWLHPTRRTWLADAPWWPDYQNRLVRNSGGLRFSGRLHEGAEPRGPAGYLDGPLYHLDLLQADVEARRAKARRYQARRPGLALPDGAELNHAYYLPERQVELDLRAVPDEDVALLDEVLAAAPGPAPPPRGRVRTATSEEVERWAPTGPLDESGRRGEVQLLGVPRLVAAGAPVVVHARMTNRGGAIWRWGPDSQPFVRLGLRWRRADGAQDPVEGRGDLPRTLAPGESTVVAATLPAPDEPGSCVLELDVVEEHVRWFGVGVACPVEVRPAAPPWDADVAALLARPSERQRRRAWRRAGAGPSALYLGWLGHGNLGDEAMGAAVAEHLAGLRLRMPAHPIAAGALRDVSAVILGGGTLIGHRELREPLEVFLERRPHGPVVTVGTGVDDPAFRRDAGAEDPEELARWAAVLRRATPLTVRGERSRELLAGLGVEARAVGDPALLLRAPARPEPPGRVLGLNVGVAWRIWGGQPQLLLDELAELGRRLLRMGWTLRVIPVWGPDAAFAEALARAIPGPVDLRPVAASAGAFFEAVAGCRVVVAQKLHAVALATVAGVPTVALEYHPKVAELQRSLGAERHLVRTDEVVVDDLLAMVLELDADREAHRRRLAGAVAARRRARRGVREEVQAQVATAG